MNQDEQLFHLVQKLQGRLKEMDDELATLRLQSLRLVGAQDVPEETLVAIAAAVAAYLGFRGSHVQPRFATSRSWVRRTRLAQLNRTTAEW